MKTIRMIAASAALLAVASCGDARAGAAATDTGIEQQNPEGVTVQKVDTLTLVTLKGNEGEKRMPNKLFYGQADSAKVERLSPEGSVPSSISCFVVCTQGKNILFDTGNGAARGGKMLERLKAAGIEPEEIDLVMLTHFHGDHIGELVAADSAVFPRAQVYAPEEEYAAWSAMEGEGAEMAMQALAAYEGRLHRFLYTDELPLGVKALAAPGHTPGHTVYQIGRIFVAGDLIHGFDLQIQDLDIGDTLVDRVGRHGFDLQIQDLDICPSYDSDPKQAAETRKRYIDYIRQNELTTAGMHFPGNGVKDRL